MRRFVPAIAALMLAAVPAAALQAPAPIHAAATFDQTTITGRLVAAPQDADNGQSGTLLVQVDGRTALVFVGGQTQIVDLAGNTIGIRTLHDGDQLQIVGDNNGSMISASLVRDLSVGAVPILQLKGQLALAPSQPTAPPSGVLCLASTQIAGVVVPRAQTLTVATCASGQTPLFLNATTRITNADGGAVTMADLKQGDSLTATASLPASGQLIASAVRDLSLQAAPIIHLKGQLASVVALPVATSAILCVANGTITGVTQSRVQLQVSGGCATNQLTLYVSAATRIANRFGTQVQWTALQVGDDLRADASINPVDGHLNASTVLDASIPARFTLVTGTIVARPSDPDPGHPGSLLLQVGKRTFLIRVTGQTQIVDRVGTPLTIADLRDRATVRVYGSYNGSQITALHIRDLSLPSTAALTLKGQLASVINPTLPAVAILCLANTQITGVSLPSVQVQIASACASGQTPLYLGPGTAFANQFGSAVSLANLAIGDTLRVRATLDRNGHLLATLVQDGSR